jgi:hypothetical protein
MAVVLTALSQIYAWYVSPGRRIARFVHAVQHRDFAAMIALADASETQRLGLNPVTLGGIISDIAGNSGRLVADDTKALSQNEKTHRYIQGASVSALDEHGRFLPGRLGHPAKAYVFAYRTDHSWKIALSRFVVSLYRSRNPRGRESESYHAICQRHGVHSEFYQPEDDEWKPFPAPARPIGGTGR